MFMIPMHISFPGRAIEEKNGFCAIYRILRFHYFVSAAVFDTLSKYCCRHAILFRLY